MSNPELNITNNTEMIQESSQPEAGQEMYSSEEVNSFLSETMNESCASHVQFDSIEPIRLTFVPTKNDCMFCENPHGSVYLSEPLHLLGWYSCEKCIDIARKIQKDWEKKYGLDKILVLREKNIKIKRTSGVIENDWYIDEQRFLYNSPCFDIDDNLYIPCMNAQKTIQRSVLAKDLIALNSEQC